MKNIIYTTFLFTLLLGLTSCGNLEKELNAKENNVNYILYNPFLHQLIEYDEKTGKDILWKDKDNQFQYQVPNSDDLYIDGNSLTNNFSLIKVTGNNIESLYNFGKNEGAFPISLIDNKLYFIHTYYDSNGLEKENKRKIAMYDIDSKVILEFKNTSGLINKGKSNNEYIFYTTYIPGKDKYDLKKIEIGKNKFDDEPKVLMSNLSHGDLYIKGEEVCTTDTYHIICKDSKWDNELVNYFKNSKLIQINPVESSGLRLSITDTGNNKEDIVIDKVDGLKFDSGYIIIGTDKGLQKYKL